MKRPAGHAWIARPELAQRVSTALTKGCLVTAPAGYGKTTVLEQAVGAGVTSAWVRCTPEARDGGQLVSYLVAAIGNAVPGAAGALHETIGSAQERIDAAPVTRALVAELDQLLVDPLAVIFDDAEHVAGSAEAEAVLATLLQAAGGMLRVAVASRRPVAPGPEGLGTDGYERLDARDLAFSAGECAAYVRHATGREPSQAEVDRLLAATEGWPLAVSTLVLAGGWGASERSTPLRSPGALRAFLAEEVLGGLDRATRRMVLDSAVVRVLTPRTLGALGLPDDFVDALRERGLFLRPVEGSGHTYHPLFREVVLERLEAESSPEHVAGLHGRVAPAVAAQGAAAEAVEHWLAARDWPAVTAALAAEARTLAGTSPALVRGWVDRLPAPVRDTPVVRLLEGQLAWGGGDFPSAVVLLRAALAGGGLAEDPTSAWWARFLLMDSLTVAGDLEGAVTVAQGFDHPDARPAGVVAAVAGLYAAHCLAALGREEDAERLASVVRQLPERDLLAPVEIQRKAYLHVPAGRLDQALAESTAALRMVEGNDPLLLRFNVLSAIALVLADQGRIEEALAWWQRTAADATASLLPSKARAAHAFCALHLAQLGRLAEADAELASHEPVGTWVGWTHHTARAVVASARGDPSGALAAARDAWDAVRPAALQYRHWTAVLLAPVLVRSGAEDWAARLMAEMAVEAEATFPGARGRLLHCRLRAFGAWLAACRGETATAVAMAARSMVEAGDAGAYLVRWEWERLEPLVTAAVAGGALDAGAVVAMVAAAFPDGAALVRLAEHADAGLRRAALAPALGSGHPAARAAVTRARSDSHPEVAAAARDALAGGGADAPPRLFSTLGGFAVRRGGWRIDERDWGRPLDARIVRYLLVHRAGPVPEADLFDALWPGAPPERARRSLQVAVSRIRAVLDHPRAPASLIEVSAGTYRLCLAPGDVVDWEQFEAAARAALARPQPSRPQLEEARARWGGEPLPRERYSDWASAWRERLTELYLDVLTALVERYGQDGDHGAAIVAAREMVALDPLSEAAHRDLMAAYARAGRRGQALRQYLECRRALVVELGVEPALTTTRLHAAILAGEDI